jgi:hypothetical protein
MKGLIVAGVAGIAGVAGVVGLSSAATGGGGDAAPAAPVPALTRAATGTTPSLDDRVADVRRAERAADRALARTAPAASARRSTDDDGTFDQGPGDRDPVTGAFIDDDDDRFDRDDRDDRFDRDDRDDRADRDDDHRGRDDGHHRGRGRGDDHHDDD